MALISEPVSTVPHIVYRPFGLMGSRLVRDLKGLPPLLARSGPLELRLAVTKKEIKKAQRLRFRVFYEQGGASPSPNQALSRRDKCPFDRFCDHLIVLDTSPGLIRGQPRAKVVGTYRLLRRDMLDGAGRFYSAAEFDLQPLLDRHPKTRILELGRSCVHVDYRSKNVIDLLWRGIATYAAHHGMEALIGCASLSGGSVQSLTVPLSFVHHFASADPDWQVIPVAGRVLHTEYLSRDAIDPRKSLMTLPPLMKAYVRAGSTFSSPAAVDLQFNTVDLFAVLPLASLNARYRARFVNGAAAPEGAPLQS